MASMRRAAMPTTASTRAMSSDRRRRPPVSSPSWIAITGGSVVGTTVSVSAERGPGIDSVHDTRRALSASVSAPVTVSMTPATDAWSATCRASVERSTA